MAIGSASSSISQSIVQQLRLQEARRSADEAQYRAQSLQAQASEAQQSADRQQERARSLRVDASQAQAQAGQASQGLSAIQSLSQLNTTLGATYTKVAQAQAQASTQTQASTQAPVNTPPQPAKPAVVNAQGQTIGKVVNTTA